MPFDSGAMGSLVNYERDMGSIQPAAGQVAAQDGVKAVAVAHDVQRAAGPGLAAAAAAAPAGRNPASPAAASAAQPVGKPAEQPKVFTAFKSNALPTTKLGLEMAKAITEFQKHYPNGKGAPAPFTFEIEIEKGQSLDQQELVKLTSYLKASITLLGDVAYIVIKGSKPEHVKSIQDACKGSGLKAELFTEKDNPETYNKIDKAERLDLSTLLGSVARSDAATVVAVSPASAAARSQARLSTSPRLREPRKKREIEKRRETLSRLSGRNAELRRLSGTRSSTFKKASHHKLAATAAHVSSVAAAAIAASVGDGFRKGVVRLPRPLVGRGVVCGQPRFPLVSRSILEEIRKQAKKDAARIRRKQQAKPREVGDLPLLWVEEDEAAASLQQQQPAKPASASAAAPSLQPADQVKPGASAAAASAEQPATVPAAAVKSPGSAAAAAAAVVAASPPQQQFVAAAPASAAPPPQQANQVKHEVPAASAAAAGPRKGCLKQPGVKKSLHVHHDDLLNSHEHDRTYDMRARLKGKKGLVSEKEAAAVRRERGDPAEVYRYSDHEDDGDAVDTEDLR